MSMLVHFHNIGRIFIFFLSVYTGALTPIWQLMTLDIDTQACQDTVSKSNLYVNAFHYVMLILLKSQMKYIIQTKKKACWQLAEVRMLRIARRNFSQSSFLVMVVFERFIFFSRMEHQS